MERILKHVKETVDLPAGTFISLDKMEVDVEETLGTITFLAKATDVNATNEDGTVGELRFRTYQLLSSVQESDFRVRVKPEVAEKEFTAGQVVRLVNPVFENYAVNRNTDGFTVTVDDIVLVSATSTPQQPEKRTPQN